MNRIFVAELPIRERRTYVRVVAAIVVATAAISIYDTYLLISLLAG